MLKFRYIIVMLLCVFSVALLAETTFAQEKKVSRGDVVKRMKNSQTYFTETVSDPETAIPEAVLKKASGFVILRQLKLGFIFGATGGGGFAIVKDEESGEIFERILKAAHQGKLSKELWVTPGLPFLVFITVGFIIALIFGDILWFILYSVLG